MSNFSQFDPNKLKINSKAVSPDYHPEAFFFVETTETGETRMPCWSPDPAPFIEIVFEILKSFPAEVEVLIKAKAESSVLNPDGPDEWIRFHGYASNQAVQTALTGFRKLLLCDSTHQFMVRSTETGEYLVFDDYGILWIYSDNEQFKELLVARGFKEKNQPLIYEGPVWRFTAPKGQLKELTDFLMLDEVDKPQQENPPEIIQ